MAPERILIVEDKVATEGQPLQMNLQKWGYDVVGIAETESDALEMALRKRPSVVLMDIMLGEDRFAGLRAARQIRTATGAQIIFISGVLEDPDVLSEAKKTPDYEFLLKPVEDRQLLASVRLAVARAKRKNLVFVAYSHGDARFAKEMMEHLDPLKELGTSPWIDTQIAPSQKWKVEIDRALGEAKAAICLVSSKFITSEFITKVELPSLLKAEELRGLRVYPVFVNYVDEVILRPLGLLEFQGINRPDDPIARWPTPKRHQDCWGLLCRWLESGAGAFSARA